MNITNIDQNSTHTTFESVSTKPSLITKNSSEIIKLQNEERKTICMIEEFDSQTLLEYLYDTCHRHIASQNHAIVKYIFQACLDPFLTIINGWIYNGEIKDPFGEEEVFYDAYDLMASEYRDNYEEILKKYNQNVEKADDFVFLDNDIYQKYHFEPAEFNSVSLYSGRYWHSVVYDAKLSKQYRYSLVASFLSGETL